jgi:hypothetical protein
MCISFFGFQKWEERAQILTDMPKNYRIVSALNVFVEVANKNLSSRLFPPIHIPLP